MQCCLPCSYLSSGPQVAMNVYELSSAAGLPCEIDPALVVALSSQKSGKKLQFKRPKWGKITGEVQEVP